MVRQALARALRAQDVLKSSSLPGNLVPDWALPGLLRGNKMNAIESSTVNE